MSGGDFLNAGEISGVFGVKGLVKVFSFTEPRENILRYSPWILRKNNQTKEIKVTGGQRQGNTVVAELEGIADRDAALALMGWEILISKQQLPKPRPGEYYWADLIGLTVKTQEGVYLGVVDHLLETGANDVLVVIDGETERLIPFVQQHTVLSIDLDTGLMVVDWDPDF
ncbi:ribosome maturation factor RimM [Methylomonas sp. SURF-2]|uniref:Ribosome maturation factor RimM n=1 Tax=Methylomonas subterranea TaxID=2952225 RepID=A0ABT1TLN3_9GAMM|nr:ribosome maturation factor RimM [Methylomonas sp. SURF-2]MCQ8106126.1 ribosome maturation factor RimM [Methylomonas sp. SURF-2]